MTEESQRPFVGVHLILIQDEKLFLMKRAVQGWLFGKYVLPAGKVEPYESPTKALIREAKEEIGIDILPTDLQHVTTIHHAYKDYKDKKVDFIEFYFKATTWQGTPVNNEPDKASEIGFFSLNELPSGITTGVRMALDALTDGPHFVEN